MSDESAALVVRGYTMSAGLFRTGFPEGGGPCKCSSTCCEGGVYADVADRDKIMAHVEMIKKYMDGTQSKDERQWFEERELEDGDFPSGRCVGTTEINNKCAFLDGRGHCSLQVAATAEGMHKWALKPFFCVLYPIEITDNVVNFDDMLQDEEPCCSIKSCFELPLFAACREELVYLVGEDGYETMAEHYRKVQQSPATHPKE